MKQRRPRFVALATAATLLAMLPTLGEGIGPAPQAAGETRRVGRGPHSVDCQRGLGLERRVARPAPLGNLRPVFTAVTASPLTDSTAPVLGTDGQYHVVYELLIQNTKSVTATIQRIDVVAGDNEARVLASLHGADLVRNVADLAARRVDNAEIEPNGGRLVALDVTFPSLATVPRTLMHRLEALAANSPGARTSTLVSYTIAPFDTAATGPPVLGPPLAGARWVAANGCCAVGFPHRFSVQSITGRLVNAQRFAIDYMRLTEDGYLVKGDQRDVRNWAGYGASVLAVANGTIVETLDGLPDQVPGSLPDPTTITLQNVEGNHVIIDLGCGFYGFYAHLQKGSIRVKPGDRVVRGQTLGRLGNSGNTSAPHLHFHVMRGPSALLADGAPYVIDTFAYGGQVPLRQFEDSQTLEERFGVGRLPRPEPRTKQYPLQLNIIDFPKSREAGT
ncbi:MAG: M23 family metallopeptidase [Candidatus Rokuibacteriota bacterium]